MRNWGKSCFIVAFAILFSEVALAETLDKIVAVVNGDVILQSELKDRMQVLEKISPGMKTDDPERQAQFMKEVLQQLIRQRLTEGEVKRLKITVTQSEVDSAIKGIKQENNFTDAQFEYVIQQQGKNLEQFREEIRKELERSRLIDRALKSKTVITEEQVEAFLKSGKSATAKERRRIAVIFFPYGEGPEEKKAEEIEKLAGETHARLREGADFTRLAREHSKGPAAQEGGDIGFIDTEELAPPIEAATRGLKPNDITDLVKTQGGYYIIKVLDVRKESSNTADANSREKARRQLVQDELNHKFEDWLRDLESRA